MCPSAMPSPKQQSNPCPAASSSSRTEDVSPIENDTTSSANSSSSLAPTITIKERITVTTKNGLTKAKEKYMKLHDEMLEKDRLKAIEREKNESIVMEDEKFPTEWDLSVKGTRLCKRLVRYAKARFGQWQRNSKLYKILFCTTQPAHVITIAAVLCITSVLVPTTPTTMTINGTTDRLISVNSYPATTTTMSPSTRLTSFVYLASFVMHFGSQIWMTFVSGLSLYFALPRHTFGEVQRVLFPRYFTLNACLSLVTLLIYVKHHPANSWDVEVALQVISMGGAFFLELLIRLYLTPPLLRLIDVKTSLERAAGVGVEIGRHDPGPLKHCPYYLKIHRAFRRIHVAIAIANMLTMACTVLHLFHVAGKICVL